MTTHTEGLASLSRIKRRAFVKGTAGAALALAVTRPDQVIGAPANSKINLGVVGCGGRGFWIAKLFQEQGGYNLMAAGDYFPEQAGRMGELGVPEANQFSGLDCAKKMIDKCKDLDAVAIISPPCFHPEQTADAVDAGKHVYLAKPIAVDVPGCRSIADSGKKATQNKLVCLVDFQTRANEFYKEAVQRVHNGQIGDIVCGEAEYQAGRLGKRGDDQTPEGRLRNWVFMKDLSGDIITEQNIHALDVASWIMDAAPVSAVGTGGRKARVDVGDCWDHFSVIFEYPGEKIITFNSTQFAKGWDDIGCRVYGAKGTIDTHYGGIVMIRGDESYKGGRTGNIYAEGAIHNIADFHRCVTEGDYANLTVAPSVRSNLTTILGRTAAYTGKKVTWDEVMQANEPMRLNLKGLKS